MSKNELQKGAISLKEDIIIIGAGGLGREILWLLEELIKNKTSWNIKGFVDDNEILQGKMVNGYPVLGNVAWLSNYSDNISVVCCIAKPQIRVEIIEKLSHNRNLYYPNIIANGVVYSDRVKFGMGNIICVASTLTVDIELGDFNIINPSCTIGHDASIHDYNTIYPGVNVSGSVLINNFVEIGTGTQIIQGLKICNRAMIGAGSVVIRDIIEEGTYVGVPAKKIHNNIEE